ncbi:MAG: hypothetical protein CMH53_07985 [Myxococcales bacterium]|nr:hypothetical protein [Myxococcales bacterium]
MMRWTLADIGLNIVMVGVFACTAMACSDSSPGVTPISFDVGVVPSGTDTSSVSNDTTTAVADTSSGGDNDAGGAADAGGKDAQAPADAGAVGQDAALTDGAATPGDAGAGSTDTSSSGGAADASDAQQSSGTADAGAPKDTGSKDAGAPAGGCVDADKDGYGLGCVKGGDCDDANPNFALICPDCAKANHPGCPCKGTAANCYTGDPQWIGKGICQAGVQLCQGGYWGECNGEVLPTPEACDGKDNNCNALVDEGVLSSCGTCDMSCTQQKMGPDFGNPFSLDGTNANGVGLDANGYIVLDSKSANKNLNHIWIANHGEATVSKLNTKTGKEEARYKTCNNPSRTSVDLDGNAWVACRSDGGVAKLLNDKKDCKDKNGNGTIDTSTDLNGDGKISGNEMKALMQDECMSFLVYPDEKKMARAAGVDADNHAWIGFWYTSRLKRLEPVNGNAVDTINLKCAPYGLVIDQNGIIWVAGRSCKALERVDPKTKQTTVYKAPVSKYPYGINVDAFGRIWMASTSTFTWRFDPTNTQWTSVSHASNSRGVATSADGYVYVANDGSSSVAKINAVTLVKEAQISLGSGRSPVGMAIDYDGYVWAINYSKSSASKVNPKTNSVVGEYPVGSTPYTYSDMTGYTLNNFTAPKGHYTHIFGFGGWSGTVAENKTKTLWENIDAEVTIPKGGYVKIRYKVGDSLKDIDKQPWSKEFGPFPPSQLPIDLTKQAAKVEGRFLKVEIFLQANKDKISPIVKSVQAKGKQIPAK